MLYGAYKVGLCHVCDTACCCIGEQDSSPNFLTKKNSNDSLNAKKCDLSHIAKLAIITKIPKTSLKFIGSPSILFGSMAFRRSGEGSQYSAFWASPIVPACSTLASKRGSRRFLPSELNWQADAVPTLSSYRTVGRRWSLGRTGRILLEQSTGVRPQELSHQRKVRF